MLFPIFVLVVLWAVSLFGFNLTKHIVPILLSVPGGDMASLLCLSEKLFFLCFEIGEKIKKDDRFGVMRCSSAKRFFFFIFY